MTTKIFGVPFGIQVIANSLMVRQIEDWSGCRSTARAKRRRRLGHRQRVVMRDEPTAAFVGGMFVAHPAIIAQLKALEVTP